jgi:predicted acylesterase/phospholipase RssA
VSDSDLQGDSAMAIQDGSAAKDCLRELLDDGHNDTPFGTKTFNEEFVRHDPEGWLWKVGTKRPGLRDPAAYTQLENDNPALKYILHQSPAEALAKNSTEAAGNWPPYSEAQNAYLRTSIDVTMKGGVTSGVIYPLALCELARQFRLRNVGGASAGAIAASFAAAAEVGRATTPETEQVMTTAEFQKTAEYKQGRCRKGFAGLADIIAWLTQLDDLQAKEEFRTAQLFKPTNVAMRIFRLISALMRQRYWAVPILAATSFGRRLGIVSVLFVVVLPALLCLATLLAVGRAPSNPALAYFTAAGWLSGVSIAVFGLSVAAFLLVARARARKHAAMQAKLMTAPKVLLPEPQPPMSTSPVPYIVMFIIGVAAVTAISLGTATFNWLGFSRSVLAWLLGVLTVVIMMVSSISRLIRRAKIHRFGLIGGSTQSVDTRRLGNAFNRMMGMPRLTVETNVTDWLDQCLSDLAGKNRDAAESECVLRFGHLWDKSYMPPVDPAHPDDPSPEITAAYLDPNRRMVNLELMTTELVHRVPYRFPLKQDEPLYFRPADLESIFPQRVVDAMRAGGVADKSDSGNPAAEKKPSTYCDVDTGDELKDLCRLPDPWDLPVVFVVRISMAFPGLFAAVKLYRQTADPLPVVRDDFGAPIVDKHAGKPVRYPESGNWMQELWFSDGGITSNFPIHFFDAVLPRWPTVGINLGSHPRGFGHQDVYLPTDRQATAGVPTPLGRSMINFVSAVVDTARNWRDTAQTFMPASRGRIAWVRQRRYEGGNNLFMPSDRVAALALRGAVAGARLRRRFASEAQWQRHQWLRLRAGLKNLADLDTRVQQALREARYARLSGGSVEATAAMAETISQLKKAADPTPPGPDPFSSGSAPAERSPIAAATGPISDNSEAAESPFEWFEPEGNDFWQVAQKLLARHNSTDLPTTPLFKSAPEPSAALRQVPSI